MSNSKVIYLQRPYGSLDVQRDDVAMELRAKGYSVEAFSTVVCVNGWASPADGKRISMLTEAEAQAAIDLYKEQKAYSPNGIPSGTVRIDAVFWQPNAE